MFRKCLVTRGYTTVGEIDSQPIESSRMKWTAGSSRSNTETLIVPRTQRARRSRRGALQRRGPQYDSECAGPGSAEQRDRTMLRIADRTMLRIADRTMLRIAGRTLHRVRDTRLLVADCRAISERKRRRPFGRLRASDPLFVIPDVQLHIVDAPLVGDSRPEVQARNPYPPRGLWIPGSRKSAPRNDEQWISSHHAIAPLFAIKA
jgi:hypothetical protein